jgi:2-dehydropantoate 2-reductase
MKIAIIGPGALGCLVAASLARSGEDVWLLDKVQERAKKINNSGIKVEGIGEFSAKVRATCDAKDIEVCDLVIVCVKSYDTEEAVKEAKASIGDNTLVLTLQNGLGNEEVIAEIVGQEKVVGGVTSHGSSYGRGWKSQACRKRGDDNRQMVYSPRPQGREEMYIFPAEAGRDIGLAKESFIRDQDIDNIKEVIWSKLVINAGYNALGALTRLKNGDLFRYEWTRNVMKQTVMEAVKVAKRRRINLVYSDPVKKIESVCSSSLDNVCSMLQDVIDGQKTEIDYINGAIAAEGAALGVPTPVNSVLTDLVKALETGYGKQIGR